MGRLELLKAALSRAGECDELASIWYKRCLMSEIEPISKASADPLESARLRIVIATIAINVVAVALLVFVPCSNWRTAVALNAIDNLLLAGFALQRRDALLGRLMLFGLVTGFAELAADAWLVGFTRTLDYSVGGGWMLWRSPAWMPFAWEVVAVQFGYLGLRLRERTAYPRLGLGERRAVLEPEPDQPIELRILEGLPPIIRHRRDRGAGETGLVTLELRRMRSLFRRQYASGERERA